MVQRRSALKVLLGGEEASKRSAGQRAVFAGACRCFSKGDTETAGRWYGGGLGCSVSDGCSGLASGGRACEARRREIGRCAGAGCSALAGRREDGRVVLVLSWAR